MNRRKYIILGYKGGTFRPQNSDKDISYCTLYVSYDLLPREGVISSGQACDVLKCVSGFELASIPVGATVSLSFNEYGKVIDIDFAD